MVTVFYFIFFAMLMKLCFIDSVICRTCFPGNIMIYFFRPHPSAHLEAVLRPPSIDVPNITRVHVGNLWRLSSEDKLVVSTHSTHSTKLPPALEFPPPPHVPPLKRLPLLVGGALSQPLPIVFLNLAVGAGGSPQSHSPPFLCADRG